MTTFEAYCQTFNKRQAQSKEFRTIAVMSAKISFTDRNERGLRLTRRNAAHHDHPGQKETIEKLELRVCGLDARDHLCEVAMGQLIEHCLPTKQGLNGKHNGWKQKEARELGGEV